MKRPPKKKRIKNKIKFMSRKGEGKEKGRKKDEVGIWKSSNCTPTGMKNWHQISS